MTTDTPANNTAKPRRQTQNDEIMHKAVAKCLRAIKQAMIESRDNSLQFPLNCAVGALNATIITLVSEMQTDNPRQAVNGILQFIKDNAVDAANTGLEQRSSSTN